MSKLTSQERVQRMMTRKDHDRVPRHDSFWNETVARWKTQGLNGDGMTALRLLQYDMASLNLLWPVVYPGRREVISEDEETQVFIDGQGQRVRYWKHKSGTPEHLGFECQTRQQWETIFKPTLLKTGNQNDIYEVKKNYEQARNEGKWTYLVIAESFEELRSIIGDEAMLMGMVEDPDWIVDISRTFTDVTLKNLNAIMSTGIKPDGMWIYGDMAFKTATLCSPAMYKELIWPDHKRLVDWAHSHGLKVIYHTDGNVNAVLDLFVEVGFDCLQPMESKAGMDIRKIAPVYGDRLSFMGNIDVMVMATNDKVKIEQEIKEKFAVAKTKKGYCYHSDHSVPPLVDWDTYQFIIQMVDKFGSYE